MLISFSVYGKLICTNKIAQNFIIKKELYTNLVKYLNYKKKNYTPVLLNS